EQRLARIEPQAGFLLFFAVAGKAVFDEHRPDALLEELRLLRRNRRIGGADGAGTGENEADGKANAAGRHWDFQLNPAGETCRDGGGQRDCLAELERQSARAMSRSEIAT